MLGREIRAEAFQLEHDPDNKSIYSSLRDLDIGEFQ